MRPLLKIGINEITKEGITSIFHRLSRKQYNHYKPLQTETGNLCIILGGPYDAYIHQGKIKELENYRKNTDILFIDETHYTKYKDVVEIVKQLDENKTQIQFIFKESLKVNENNCFNRFNQNTSFKVMISESIYMNNKCLPTSIHGFNFKNNDNYKININFTGLQYKNGIENNIFNYYKTGFCNENENKLEHTSGSFMSSHNKDFVSYYKENQFENNDYLNEVVDEYLENIRNDMNIDYDSEVYWKTHFICNVAKISTQKKETIDIPYGLTIDESLAFLSEIKN